MQLQSWIEGGRETFCGEELVDSGGISKESDKNMARIQPLGVVK